MPWLPLAILLIATLTVAALALILFPLGEEQEERPEDDNFTDDARDEAAEENLSSPLAGGDPPLAGEGEIPLAATDHPHEPA